MSDRDPYAVLGVERSASQDAIQKAYRKLAKKYHPDLNPGDETAEQEFKKAANAHAILGDPKKRAQFDRGEIDASGQEKPPEPKRPKYDGAEFMAQDGVASETAQQAILNEVSRAGGSGARQRPTRRAALTHAANSQCSSHCTRPTRRTQLNPPHTRRQQ